MKAAPQLSLFAPPAAEPPPRPYEPPPGRTPQETLEYFHGQALLDEVFRQRSAEEWRRNREHAARQDCAADFSANRPVSCCRLELLDELEDGPRAWDELTLWLWQRDAGELAGTTADRARRELLLEGYLVETSAGLAVNPAHPSRRWAARRASPAPA
jgi:hypothetical protein